MFIFLILCSAGRMWPLYAFIRSSAPYIVFPFAVIVGGLGYIYETKLRKVENKNHYFKATITEKRDERLLNEINSNDPTDVKSLKFSNYPKTIFDINVSPPSHQRHFTSSD